MILYGQITRFVGGGLPELIQILSVLLIVGMNW